MEVTAAYLPDSMWTFTRAFVSLLADEIGVWNPISLPDLKTLKFVEWRQRANKFRLWSSIIQFEDLFAVSINIYAQKAYDFIYDFNRQ